MTLDTPLLDGFGKGLARLSYELLGYVLPGLAAVAGAIGAWTLDGEGRAERVHSWLAEVSVFEGVLLVGGAYVTGRLLYVLADFTIKPTVKLTVGDPDKYLPAANIAPFRRWASDYSPEFKEALRAQMEKVVGGGASRAPMLKLVEAWLYEHKGGVDTLQEHNHAVEIMARNLAAAGLSTSVIAIAVGQQALGLAAIVYTIAMTYYYYVRQIKRARCVFEHFYVLSKPDNGRETEHEGDYVRSIGPRQETEVP